MLQKEWVGRVPLTRVFWLRGVGDNWSWILVAGDAVCAIAHMAHMGKLAPWELAASWGVKATTYWLTTTGIKLGLWVGSAVWLMRWLGIDSRSVMEEQLHHEAAVSSEGEASLNLCFAIFCIILYQSSTGSIVPCWLSWLDSQHTVRHEGG